MCVCVCVSGRAAAGSGGLQGLGPCMTDFPSLITGLCTRAPAVRVSVYSRRDGTGGGGRRRTGFEDRHATNSGGKHCTFSHISACIHIHLQNALQNTCMHVHACALAQNTCMQVPSVRRVQAHLQVRMFVCEYDYHHTGLAAPLGP